MLYCRTIAKPFEAKMAKSKALLVLVGIWVYASPFALLPYFEIWSRFVPGETEKRLKTL